MPSDAVSRVFAGAADALPSKEDRALIFQRQKGICFGCDKPLNHAVIYGHLIPRSRGGEHCHENRVGLHTECERDRGDRMPASEEAAKQRRIISA